MREIEEVKEEIKELKLEVFSYAASERRIANNKEKAFKKIIELRKELEELVGAPEELLEEIEFGYELEVEEE